jgi:hypothetical protein
MTARQIARQLEVDRAHVNRILHSSLDHFEKVGEANWRHRPRDLPTQLMPRPQGPFGPAKNLLPEDQELHCAGATDRCIDVLRKMLDCGYSAVPVQSNGLVIGVATFESIHEHLLTLANGTLRVSIALDTPIQSACHSPEFIDADAYVDQTVDWQDIQYVIVGTATQPVGILTVSDVWKRLNNFSEAFVLIHEIETGIRSLIETVAKQQHCDLQDWLGSMSVPPGQSPPDSLLEMTFSQYLHLITNRSVYSHFRPFLGETPAFAASFTNVNKIRNEVMHFRTSAGAVDNLKPLRQFRIAVAGWLNQAKGI